MLLADCWLVMLQEGETVVSSASDWSDSDIGVLVVWVGLGCRVGLGANRTPNHSRHFHCTALNLFTFTRDFRHSRRGCRG